MADLTPIKISTLSGKNKTIAKRFDDGDGVLKGSEISLFNNYFADDANFNEDGTLVKNNVAKDNETKKTNDKADIKEFCKVAGVSSDKYIQMYDKNKSIAEINKAIEAEHTKNTESAKSTASETKKTNDKADIKAFCALAGVSSDKYIQMYDKNKSIAEINKAIEAEHTKNTESAKSTASETKKTNDKADIKAFCALAGVSSEKYLQMYDNNTSIANINKAIEDEHRDINQMNETKKTNDKADIKAFCALAGVSSDKYIQMYDNNTLIADINKAIEDEHRDKAQMPEQPAPPAVDPPEPEEIIDITSRAVALQIIADKFDTYNTDSPDTVRNTWIEGDFATFADLNAVAQETNDVNLQNAYNYLAQNNLHGELDVFGQKDKSKSNHDDTFSKGQINQMLTERKAEEASIQVKIDNLTIVRDKFETYNIDSPDTVRNTWIEGDFATFADLNAVAQETNDVDLLNAYSYLAQNNLHGELDVFGQKDKSKSNHDDTFSRGQIEQMVTDYTALL